MDTVNIMTQNNLLQLASWRAKSLATWNIILNWLNIILLEIWLTKEEECQFIGLRSTVQR